MQISKFTICLISLTIIVSPIQSIKNYNPQITEVDKSIIDISQLTEYSPTLDFHGLAYGAYRSLGPPMEFILRNNVIQDLEILKRLNVTHIRTYGVNYGQKVIPQEANNAGIECATGIWLESNTTYNHYVNEYEISTGIQLANISSHLIVGNEAILTDKLSLSELITYINLVKNQTNTPVTTAEPWSVFYQYPSLVTACDALFVHVYAYWEGRGASPIWDDQAAEYTVDRIEYLQNKYPDKEIYLAEAGWPSGPLALGDPDRWSEKAQKAFYNDLLPLLAEKGIKHYLFSAFDEHWKEEGGVGPYWGIFRSDRTPKPSAEVLVKYFGGEVDWPSPISTSPPDFNVQQDSQANISWIITDIDNSTGTFEVLEENMKLDLAEKTWTNGTEIVINIDTSTVGSFNYTIVFSDGISEVQDTVIVNITAVTTTTTTTTASSTPGFYVTQLILTILFIGILRKIRLKINFLK